MCTGGFGYDPALMGEYRPDLIKTVTTNGAFTTGDGIKMAREIGCELVDMDKVADSYEVGQSCEWHSLRSLYGDLQPATV